jgi:fluoride exporter
MNNYLLVFLGGGIGCVMRYLISNSAYTLIGQDFPYGTLVVNVSGSFLMGLLFILILERFTSFVPQLRSFLLIGFLGGYTTFSAFSIETFNLIMQGANLKAFANIALSVTLCLVATWLGVLLGRNV